MEAVCVGIQDGGSFEKPPVSSANLRSIHPDAAKEAAASLPESVTYMNLCSDALGSGQTLQQNGPEGKRKSNARKQRRGATPHHTFQVPPG